MPSVREPAARQPDEADIGIGQPAGYRGAGGIARAVFGACPQPALGAGGGDQHAADGVRAPDRGVGAAQQFDLGQVQRQQGAEIEAARWARPGRPRAPRRSRVSTCSASLPRRRTPVKLPGAAIAADGDAGRRVRARGSGPRPAPPRSRRAPITVTGCPVSSTSIRVPVAVTVIGRLSILAPRHPDARRMRQTEKETPRNRYLCTIPPIKSEHVAHGGGSAGNGTSPAGYRYTPPGAERPSRAGLLAPGSVALRPPSQP